MRSSWTIIFYNFVTQQTPVFYHEVISSTTELLQQHINITQIYIFSNDKLFNVDSLIVEDPLELMLQTTEIELNRGQSVMVFGPNFGLKNSIMDKSMFRFLRADIYNKYIPNEDYDILLSRYGLRKLIVPDFLTLPWSPDVVEMWKQVIVVYNNFKMIGELNNWYSMILSLSFINQGKINFEPAPPNLSSLYNIGFYADMVEKSLKLINPKQLSNKITDSEYFYYPRYDVIIDRNNSVVNNYDSDLFNTAGYYHKNTSTLTDKLFLRYTDAFQGLFIKPQKSPWVIPKIFHYLILDEELDIIKIKDRLEQILRKSWEVNIWTAKSFLAANNIGEFWRNLYSETIDTNIRIFVLYCGILERYGGFITNSNYELLKSIPNIVLNNQTVFGYKNLLNGLDMTYHMIGSVPGSAYGKEVTFDNHYLARLPAMGNNNFFRQVALEQEIKIKPIRHNNTTTIFESLKPILMGLQDIRELRSHLITLPNITILPDYYFDKLDYPDYFNKFTILNKISSLQIQTQSNSNPQRLNRSYVVTQEAMDNRIIRNPRDTLIL